MVLLSPLRWLSPLHWLFAPIRWAFRLLSLCILAGVVYLGFTVYQVVRYASALPSSAATLVPAKAIVVLGVPLLNGAPGPALQARLAVALALYRARVSNRILVTGPPAAHLGAVTEPGASVRWLEHRRVPRASVRVVTAANAHTALDLVGTRLGRGATAVVVTDAVDALFVERLATGAGLKVQLYASSQSQRSLASLLTHAGPLWRSTTALAIGRIVGYGRVGWGGG